jgi:2-keto-3-deoxy-L-rhamnonate aldolase RhmA
LHEEEYLLSANDSLVVLIQLETKEALANVDDLLKVEGIDCLFVGPNDLGASLRGLADRRNPEVEQIIEGVLHKCLEADRAFGIDRGSAQAAQEWFVKGASLIAAGEDTYFMWEAATQFLRAMGR